MKDLRRTQDEPHDRLTRICAAMTDTFDTHSEHHVEDKCMVFLDDGVMGGLVMHGYDDDIEAISDLLVHLTAMFRANGKDLQIVSIPDDLSEIGGL